MANFSNHRRFSLRCLSKGLIPVSVTLKSNIKTPKGRQIIQKAEIALLNESQIHQQFPRHIYHTKGYMYKPTERQSRQGNYGEM